jgi:predicted nucleic acid-binding protein
MADDELPLIYLDACIYLSYLEDDPQRGPVIEELFSRQRAGEIRIVTSAITQVEVAFDAEERESGNLDEETLERIDELWLPGSPTEIIEFEDLVAAQARDLIRMAVARGWGLKPPDAIHLATGAQYGCAEIFTYDDKWFRYSPHLGVSISEPHNPQERLGPAS